MISNTILLILNFIMVHGGFFQEFDLPYYDDIREDKFRRNFSEHKKENEIKNRRTEFLDKYLFNDTVYLDGIMHYEINENNKNKNQIEKIEEEFATVLAMRGVKYTFKRGLIWRTWREVTVGGGKKVICYVCDSIIKGNCSYCHGGHWIIEDNPPCPYELFSIKENKICAKNYTQYTYITNDCPSRIMFEELGVGCDNPIETIWRISRDYKAVKYPSLFCNGKDYCDVTTLYNIDSQGITFRMINSSNIIFYSRVMRDGGKNYACINDCGYWDPNTKKIVAQSKPLTINLIKRSKMKREDVSSNNHKSTQSNKQSPKSHTKIKNKIKKSHRNILSMNEKNAGKMKNKFKATTISYCKQLEKKEDVYDYEDSDYE